MLESLPQLSQLQASAVRAALGPRWRDVKFIDVAVLAEDGGMPFAGRVQLGLVRRGRGVHLGVVCPSCHEPRGVLRLDGQGRLLCQFRCYAGLSRQQRRKNTSEWDRGDRQLDALVRLLQKPNLTSGALRRAAAMAEELIDADLARLVALEPELRAITASREHTWG